MNSNYFYAKHSLTARYDSQVSTTKYAKILKMTRKTGVQNKWWNFAIIRLNHGNDKNGYEKRYYIYMGEHNVCFKDLTPDAKGIECFLSYDDNKEDYILYAKGSLQFCPILVQVDYCEAIGYVHFYPNEKFINDKPSTNVLEAAYDTPAQKSVEFTLENGWAEYSAAAPSVIKREGNQLYLDIQIKGGSTGSSVVVSKIKGVTIPNIRFIKAYQYNGTSWSETFGFVRTNGEVVINNVTATSRVVIQDVVNIQ